MDKPIIAVTMGDPAGIGPEICLKALANPQSLHAARIVLIGDKRFFDLYGKIPPNVELIDLKNADPKKIKIGRLSAEAGRASVEYIETAIDLALAHKVNAIATAPINKTAIHKAGYKYNGHTEILAKRTKTKKYAMMFVSDTLWVILVTTHVALAKVPWVISKNRIIDVIELAHSALSTVRGKAPRIAVAGLNPHAGEDGIFGKEEIKKIKPAVEEAKRRGINVEGPISPDAVFYLAKIGKYDIVVSMYHDQGLIPLKLLSFNNSVNVTVGLPFVRTSVDHGTGFDIAGFGRANPSSLIQAIKVASHFVKS